jgi:signal peptidase I
MMMQFFKPMRGCRVVASESHPTKKKMDYIGRVVKVDGDQIVFVDSAGETHWMIWRFKDGNNPTIYFEA